VCVDQQHGVVDYASMVPMLQAIGAAGAAPITRVLSNDPYRIMKALDAGALGVIVPLVNDAGEAANAVAACRYPPHGIRSYGPIRASSVIGSRDPEDLAGEVLCIVMVETREGLENVEEIAATPGIDGIYIGPADLALSLGLPPSTSVTQDAHIEAVRRIREACRKHDRRGDARFLGDVGEAARRGGIRHGNRRVRRVSLERGRPPGDDGGPRRASRMALWLE
jgi:4-hydroxy-2-oxoheptanedioate aldolase